MKRFSLFLLFVLFSITVSAQSNYLNYFLDNQLLDRICTQGYTMVSGKYDSINRIYVNCEFKGKSKDWDIKVETNASGKIETLVYSFTKYKKHSIIPSSTELKNIAESVINVSGARVTNKNLIDRRSESCRLDYQAILRSTSAYRYKTANVTGAWSYNDFGQVFFNYLNVMYIMTGN